MRWQHCKTKDKQAAAKAAEVTPYFHPPQRPKAPPKPPIEMLSTAALSSLGDWLELIKPARRVYAGRVVVGLGADPLIFTPAALFVLRRVFDVHGAGVAEHRQAGKSRGFAGFWAGKEGTHIMKSVDQKIAARRPATHARYTDASDPVRAPRPSKCVAKGNRKEPGAVFFVL